MALGYAIVISEEAFDRIEEYAHFMDISVEQASTLAILGWMETTGDNLRKFIEKRENEIRRKPTLTLIHGAKTA